MNSAHKIIFSGPVGAGKSTALASISDIEPFTTEEYATDETRERKETTTVAMDYGLLKLENGERIHLYGTPGQERFNFMWEILTEGAIGLIILVDNMRPDPLADLQFYLDAFKDFIGENAVAVGVTRTDLEIERNDASLRIGVNDYQRLLSEMKITAPVFEVDAREQKDIVQLLQALLFTLDPGVTH